MHWAHRGAGTDIEHLNRYDRATWVIPDRTMDVARIVLKYNEDTDEYLMEIVVRDPPTIHTGGMRKCGTMHVIPMLYVSYGGSV